MLKHVYAQINLLTRPWYNLLRCRNRHQSEICLELLIQPQQDTCDESLEYNLQTWNTPLIKAAELNIPKQMFLNTKQHELCEAASFDVWHGLEAHRPLGQLNKLRRDAYSKWRRNRITRSDTLPDTGWTEDSFFRGQSQGIFEGEITEIMYDTTSPCSECCLDDQPCQYERMPHPFEDLPSKVAASSLYSTAKLFSMDKNRRLLGWVPPRVYTTVIKKVAMRLATPILACVQYLSSFLLPVNWVWLHFEPIR